MSLCAKCPHKIPPHKCEKRELKINSDLKTYFEDDDLENLRPNSFQQAKDNVPIERYSEDHAIELPKSKDVQEMLQTMRDHKE